MKIKILGTEYDISIVNKTEDSRLEECAGICDCTDKTILIGTGYNTDLGKPSESVKKTIKHELVHAFLYESGLAENEEIIDWIALQLDKIVEAYQTIIHMMSINDGSTTNYPS